MYWYRCTPCHPAHKILLTVVIDFRESWSSKTTISIGGTAGRLKEEIQDQASAFQERKLGPANIIEQNLNAFL